MDRDELRDYLLLATLPQVAFDGWTEAAMHAGADAAGLDRAQILRAFPGGIPELMDHFNAWADRRMLAALAARDVEAMGVRERVALLVRTRFEALAPHREAVSRALAFLALPAHCGLGLKCLGRTVDAVWHGIGDASVDFNFYTKRAILAAVMGATTLYWLDDRSDGHADSWVFLDRRLDNAVAFPKIRARAGRFLNGLPDPFRLMRRGRDRFGARG